jgi:UDP:flavonoid glycosyltransferase YjiC (YdhE family)
VLVSLAHEVFVPSVAEAFGLPSLKLMTFPMLRSDLYGPAAGLPFITENKWINRVEWMGAVIAAKRFSYFRTVNRLRDGLGLPPIGDLLGSVSDCDHMMMGFYEELVPPCPSWTLDYSYIGPNIPRTDVQLSNDLEAFLTAGSKPIYIGFGSMRHSNSDELTRTLVEAANDAGVRVIMAQATSDIGSGLEDSENLYVLREYPIPHHILFPRCKAAVHHGSWITTHLATQAGIPQVVLPQASDQYFWGERLVRLGLGPKWVDMNRLKLPKLRTAIEQLATREDFEINARALAEEVRGIDGPKNAVRLFQQIEGRLQKKTTVATG